jgi:small-conductance mechanosensitive channel/CRP-like cAMP-binding protein
MTFLDRGMVFGLGVLLLDFLAWRFLKFSDERARLAIRVVLFVALSFVLWTAQISPFHVAPWAGDPARHLLAQGLELLWWLQAAQVSAALLGTVILPASLHRERLFQDVLRALVFVAAAIAAIAFVLELPVGGLLATSGALAIVLGLAVQSTLADVFSGVVLNVTQPFHLGDTVTIGDTEGEVVESNWRATTLLNGQGNFVVVPNSAAAKANIVNQSRPPKMHGMKVFVRISPSVRPAVVIAALTDAIASTTGVLSTPKATVSASIMRRTFIEYEILAYVASSSAKSATRNEIIDQAHRHLSAHGIQLDRAQRGDERSNALERLLRGIEMFQTLSDDQFAQLTGALVSEDFAAGQIIYQVGPNCPDERRALYIVASGVAALLAPHEGHEIELGRLSPGDAVGRAGILTGVSTGIKLRAIGKVSTVRLHKDALTPILQEHPEIARQMLEALVEYQERTATILAELPARETTGGGIVRRLMDGMRRLHGIVR